MAFEWRPRVKSPVDLRLLDYPSDVDQNLVCPICRCPFIQPIRLACDHTFCQDCLDRAIRNQRSDERSCPTCRRPAREDSLSLMPRILMHMLDDLLVECPNHNQGCSVHVRRGDVEDHVNLYCKHALVPCPDSECSNTVARRQYEKHCPHVFVCCRSCRLQVMVQDLEKHNKEICVKQCAVCLDCHREIVLPELKRHTQECLFAMVPCSAASIGCSWVGTREVTKHHVASCSFAALSPTLRAMQRCIEHQSGELQILRRKNEALEEGLSTLQSLLGDVVVPEKSSSLDLEGKPAAAPTTLASPSTLKAPPFDSATHHLLSLHESLREELDRLSAAVSDLDARSSTMIMNETLRVKDDMAHTNAVMASMRMQLQWLTSARLQAQTAGALHATPTIASSSVRNSASLSPVRRTSDASRQETKL